MLLLDSQTVLWLLTDSGRLGPVARETIGRSVAVHYSAATVWELTIKEMLGRIELPEEFEDALLRSGLLELSITSGHARALTQFPTLTRHDPFDRLLMAQAHVENLRLMTADRVLLAVPEAPVVDARQ